MKVIYLLIAVLMILGSCSTPKKTAPKPVTTITRADIMNGGTSYSNAVLLQVKTEREGMDEEYRWLRNLYPGYSMVRRSRVKRSSRNYDIVRIKTRDGVLKDIYFDTTSFSRGR